MSIRTSVLISVNLIALVFLGIILISTNMMINRSFDRLERHNILEDLNRLHSEVDRSLDELEKNTRDWATWDDTYGFVQDSNPGYLENNFTTNTYTNYGLSVVIIMNKNLEIRYAGYYPQDEESETIFELPVGIEYALSSLNRKLVTIGEEHSLRGLWQTPEANLMFVALPVLKSDGSGPSIGYFIMAKTVTDDYFRELKGFKGSEIIAYDLNDEQNQNLSLQEKLKQIRAEDKVQLLGKDKILARDVISDLFEKDIYLVEIISKTEATQIGIDLRNFILLLYVFLAVLQSILLNRFLRTRVLDRLLSVQSQLKVLSSHPEQRGIVQYKGNDELSVLADDINSMLAALNEAIAAKNDFFSSLSHEIRNPLNGILGMNSLLRETELSPEQVEYVDALTDSVNSLSKLIMEVLDLSKMEYFGSALHAEDFNFRDCLRSVMLILSAKAKEKGLFLQTDVSPEIPKTLNGDHSKLKQILLNLVGNGIKYTKEGKVTLSVKPDETTGIYQFRVQDTGIGIAEEDMVNLYQPFVRMGQEIGDQEGTGLGLYISKRMISLMGGTIEIESEPMNGTTVTFNIKLNSAQEASNV